MTSKAYSSEGIVLARRNYSEADRILSILSKDFGKISMIAKGVRKPTSRKRGHIEVFSQIKFQGRRGGTLDMMTEAETMDNFTGIRSDLKKAALAYYLMEVIGRTTHDGEPHKELYYLLLKYLKKVEFDKNLKTIKDNFIVEILRLLGFWPKGMALVNPEAKLIEIIERNLVTSRVGKRLLL